jgi:hypothetical protein
MKATRIFQAPFVKGTMKATVPNGQSSAHSMAATTIIRQQVGHLISSAIILNICFE